MSGFLPLRPGLWWMRRWHLPGKLVTLGVLMAVVLVATAAAPGWGGAVGAVALLYGLLALYLSLSSDLEASFAQPSGEAPSVTLKGSVSLADVDIQHADEMIWQSYQHGLRAVAVNGGTPAMAVPQVFKTLEALSA